MEPFLALVRRSPVSALEDKWADHIRETHPELPEAVIRRVARNAAATLVDPPSDVTQPPAYTLPLWVRIGLRLGGDRMVTKMLGNKVTTSIGAFIALGVTLCQSGVLPANWCLYVATATGIATGLGFLAAKDGSTGSAPGATS